MDGLTNDDGVQWLLNHDFELAHQGAWPFDMIFLSKGHWHLGDKVDGPTWPSDHPSLAVKVAPLAAQPVPAEQ